MWTRFTNRSYYETDTNISGVKYNKIAKNLCTWTTRNLNESLNVITWKCIVRSCYVILPHLELGVFEVATNFNVALKASLVFYKGMNLTTGKYSLIDCRNIN